MQGPSVNRFHSLFTDNASLRKGAKYPNFLVLVNYFAIGWYTG